MGRRKIEIQPITHERNRSVTFLKRKNGLFKKAYELGVLCSVDVAVIIFEERPGHQVKLYQYCSGDIDEIVHRHSTFDGEKDTRTAADFAHNLNAKHDNLPEGDEDEVEDEGAEHVVKSDGMTKRAEDIGIKVEPGSHSGQFADIVDGLSIPNENYIVHRAVTTPNTLLPTQMSTSGQRLSLAGMPSDRIQNGGANKKQRLAASDRWPDEDPTIPTSGPGGYSYHPASAPPSYRVPPQSSTTFPGSTALQAFSSDNGLDFPPRGHFRPMNCPPRQMPTYNHHSDAPHFKRLPTQQSQHSYPPMTSSHQQHEQQHSGELFTSILDSDPRQQSGFSPIDWPVRAPIQGARSEHGDPNDPSWLDFLSGHATPSIGQPQASPRLPGGSKEDSSWQRHRPPAVNGTISLEPASRSPSLEASPKMKSSKRSRTESGLDDRIGKVPKEHESHPPTSGRKVLKMSRGSEFGAEPLY